MPSQSFVGLLSAKVVGRPTNTGCNLLVNRTVRSVAAVLGLTILSVPSSPGTTVIHCIALAP